MELTRAGGGHDGEGLGGARVHRGVRGLGGGGAGGGRVRLSVGDLGGGVSVSRGGVGVSRLGVGVSRLGVGLSRLGVGLDRGSGGGARGGPRLLRLGQGVSRTGPRLVVGGLLRPAVTPRFDGVRSHGGRALSGGTNVVLTTSLHDTGEGRAGGKSQKGDVEHFEREQRTFLRSLKGNEWSDERKVQDWQT